MPNFVLWPPPWKRSFPGAGIAGQLWIVLVAIPLGAVAFVLAALAGILEGVYLRVSGRIDEPRMTPHQVAAILDRVARDFVYDDEWDDFTCVPMRDGRLDNAVARAVKIVEMELPAGRITVDEAALALQQIARELRALDV